MGESANKLRRLGLLVQLGHIDAVTSSGYIEGWAVETALVGAPLSVAIVDEGGGELACGLANRYRDDLADIRRGLGWCGFRLKAHHSVRRIREGRLTLVAQGTGTKLYSVYPCPYVEDGDDTIETVDQMISYDPTVLSSVEQLKGCESLFSEFIKARGVEKFIRTAYVYILGRPVDPDGLIHYKRLIRKGALSPLALIQALSESDEFRERPHILTAPRTPGFPFG